MKIREREALEYHERRPPGKLSVVATKPCLTQRDLSLAYTPGVAVPCRQIERSPEDAYRFTSKGNLVAVVSNGTAVLGLGDIGAAASKPVMEGKGVLFKRFADVDVFDIEVDTRDPEELIRTVRLLEPTFGGINLEDIKAPECFDIEQRLERELAIPVFHDDQHGTAIISGAALLNALTVVGKRIEDVRVVFNGAGAAGIACARFYLTLGVRRENLLLCDSAGVVYRGREKGMNPFKQQLAADTTARTLADAMAGADVFVGLSIADCVSRDMVRSMAAKPIVFAMANPDPEITYEEAKAARSDVIMATGRSDYPNQVNNVLGFPFIFRGALDVRARAINDQMKLAATRALASLAREDVPDAVMKAYGLERLHFGPDYLIPKPFDARVLIWEASAVAQAAMDSGVAQREVEIETYKEELERRLGKAQHVMRMMINRAKQSPRRVVLTEATDPKVLRAAQVIQDEGFAHLVLLGPEDRVLELIAEHELHLDEVTLVDPRVSPRREAYAREYFRLRQRRGVTYPAAWRAMLDHAVWGSMMVHFGEADALVAGIGQSFPETIRPPLRIIGKKPGVSRIASFFMMIARDQLYFFADPTVNIDPTPEELADIAVSAADEARRFDTEPRVAMLSFSNFGSANHPQVDKVQRATAIVRRRRPELMVDGEMQADVAVTPELVDELFPFSHLKGGANVLVFPDLQSANVSFKLLQRLGGADAIGPILLGMAKPVHVLQRGCEAKDIVHMTAIAVIDAQSDERPAAASVSHGELAPAGAFAMD